MPVTQHNHVTSIAIWHTNLAKPRDSALLARWADWLDPAEAQRMHRFQRLEQRTRFLVSHAMTRDVIARQAGILPGEVVFDHLANGKPYIAAPDAACRFFFNLTHSHDVAAVAISETGPLGLDLEWLGRKGPEVELAQRFFTEREYQDIINQPASTQHHRLLRYWTLKEAYIKAEGWGLSAGLDSFEFELISETDAVLHVRKAQAAPRYPWQFLQFSLPGRHLIALAGIAPDAQPLAVQLHRWPDQEHHVDDDGPRISLVT